MKTVFKKGDMDDVNNYRPISILPIAMKVFEKVVHYQVYDFLDSSKILSSSQSGFSDMVILLTLLSFASQILSLN